MAAFNPPKELNGFELSERSQWLLYAPTWMFFPDWRNRVFAKGMADYMVRWDALARGVDVRPYFAADFRIPRHPTMDERQ